MEIKIEKPRIFKINRTLNIRKVLSENFLSYKEPPFIKFLKELKPIKSPLIKIFKELKPIESPFIKFLKELKPMESPLISQLRKLSDELSREDFIDKYIVHVVEEKAKFCLSGINVNDKKDIINDTCINMIRVKDSIEDIEKYTFASLRNAKYRYWRKKERQKTATIESDFIDPREEIVKKIQFEAFRNYISSKDKLNCMIFDMLCSGSRKNIVNEICKELDISDGKARYRLYKLIKELQILAKEHI